MEINWHCHCHSAHIATFKLLFELKSMNSLKGFDFCMNDNCYILHLLSAHFMSDAVLSASHTLSHLNLHNNPMKQVQLLS